MIKTIRELGVKVSLAYDKVSLTNLDNSIGRLKNSMGGLALGVTAAAGSIFGLAEQAADNAFEYDLHAKSLGMTTDRLQEMTQAGKVFANISREEITGSLEGLAGVLTEVRAGSVEAANKFKALGIEGAILTDKTITAEQMYRMVGDGLNNVGDGVKKAALANEFFGSAGAKTLKLFEGGIKGYNEKLKEVKKAGLIISPNEIKRQAAFMVELNKLSAILKNLAYIVGGALMPVVKQVSSGMIKWVGENKKLITSGATAFFKGLAGVIKGVWSVVMEANTYLQKFVQYLGGAEAAASILLKAFIAMKAIQIGASIIEIGGAFAGLAVAMLPFLAAAGALATVTGAIQSIWTVLSGGKFEDTWLFKAGEMIEKFSGGMISKPAEMLFDALHGSGSGDAAAVGNYKSPSAMFAGGGSGMGGGSIAPVVNNQITIPPGTSNEAAIKIVSSGTVEGLRESLRAPRNQVLGGKKY